VLYCNRVFISNHFRDNGHYVYLGHDLDLSRSSDVIGHVTNRSAICHFLLVSHCNRTSISNRFRDIRPPIPVCTHTHQHTQKHSASDFIFCPMQCIALDRQKLVTYRICIISEGCMSQLSPDCAPTCYSQDCITYKLPPYSILTAVYLIHNHQTNGWTERRV